MTKNMDHIYLYGPPGSGKSSVGRILAENLNLEFVDLDAKIEETADAPIPQIMEEWGESGFRDMETAALKRVSRGYNKVISLGGGALLRDQNRAYAESKGRVICFDADLKTLQERLRGDPTIRPLLAGKLEAQLFRLIDERRAHYESFSLRQPVANKTPVEIAREIQLMLGRYYISGMGQGYNVMIQESSFDHLPEMLRMSGLGPPVVVICDETVAPLYGDVLITALRRTGYGYNHPHMITIPAGEAHKNLESVMKFWRRFLEAGLDRKSTVIALGGGVIGDLAGFAASTFMRGVSWVNIPTTLLSMVDASIGGKTGFDLPQGKNLIGTFFPPRLVLANPYLLATLPVRELRSGMAEVVKHGLIADPKLFELCGTGGLLEAKTNITEIVRRGMAVKIQIVEADPYERGLRAALNLGHTLGHAVESASNFRLRHGEAVAIGLVAEARLSEQMGIAKKGLADQIAETLQALTLPVEIPQNLSREAIVRFMRMDKKREKGTVKFALPVQVGKVQVGVAVDDLNLIFPENS